MLSTPDMSICHAKIARVRLLTDAVDLSGTHAPLYLNKTCTHHSLNNTACLEVLFNEWPDTRSYSLIETMEFMLVCCLACMSFADRQHMLKDVPQSQTETAARPDGLGGLISPPPES